MVSSADLTHCKIHHTATIIPATVLAMSMFVSPHWEGNLCYRKVSLCGTEGRVHHHLLTALTHNNRCHMWWPHLVSHGEYVPHYTFITYHIICLFSSLVLGLLKAGGVSYLAYSCHAYHVPVSHRHSVSELIQFT